MSKLTGAPLSNLPWQDRPQGCQDPVWRYRENPIIGRDAIPSANSVLNSAVVPFEGGFAGIFRIDSKAIDMDIYAGFSKDGIHWDISHQPLSFLGDPEVTRREYRYDPRVCLIDDQYYVTWCNGYHGPTIGIARTTDFRTFHQIENAFLPYNRNGVLFPRKIGAHYAMLSRPSDSGHTPFGDIFCSLSPDLEFWGRHRFVMGATGSAIPSWQSTKIGAGPIPIETDEGWLLIYHGVLANCNGFVYRMGCALLDLEKPWEVKLRSRDYLLAPHMPYECMGDVPNVVFPCSALTDPATGRIAIYYGCADSVMGLAFTTVDDLMRHMKTNSLEVSS